MGFEVRIRGRGLGVPWRQLITVLTGVAVIVAMVVIAETARHTEERHQRVQVLVERVRARSQEIGSLTWMALAESTAGGRSQKFDPSTILNRGLAIWEALNATVSGLQQSDRSPMTMALVDDASRLYKSGWQLVPDLTGGSPGGFQEAQRVFTPVLQALDRDSQADAAVQQHVASQAATRAGVAFLASFGIGLVLLALLGLQFYRLRRRALIVEERRAIERRSEQRIRALVENSSDIITVVAPDLTVRWQSSTIQRALGHASGDVAGRRLQELVHPDDAQLVESHFAAATAKPGTVTFTARVRNAAGDWRHLEAIAENRLADPAIEGIVLSMRDISERKALEDELRHQAFHDGVTGLANRALFEDRLAHGLAGVRRHGRPVGVLFLDLDDFKTINDSLGHSSGDELLRAVAIRIAGVIRVTDTAARLGGDEFAVLLEIMDDEHNAQTIATRLLDALAPPITIQGRQLRVTASIGVAQSDGSLGVDELLRNADIAMYAAKEAGKGTMQTFEPGMHKRALDRLELTGEMQRALEREEFQLDYQPIVELQGGHIVGAEALVRWAHPERGRLAPGHFIGLAEETGLIVPLGGWILNAACTQAALWQRQHSQCDLYINVNVSTRQLHDPDFPATVTRVLEDTGLDPGLLVLEITESLLPDDSEEIIAQLHTLKALGVRVAVDDFGTGYSALSRLQAYPVDILKIDRSFISGIEDDRGKGQLVRGIVNLGQSLKMSVVAEGIEQPAQAEQLRRMHSPLGQGYLFSRPIAEHELERLLELGEPLLHAAAEVRVQAAERTTG